MSGQPGHDQAAVRRKRLIAVTAALVGLTIVVPIAGAFLHSATGTDQPGASPTTGSTPAASTIKPLMVRSVISAESATPEQCATVPRELPGPPGTLRTCSFTKTELYTLGPETVRLDLTGVAAAPSLMANDFTVQVAMTAASAQVFHDFSAARVGQQIAFVRAGIVVAAPAIREPIDSQTLQLSGALNAEQSKEIERLLREER